jgi:hypothetical protein
MKKVTLLIFTITLGFGILAQNKIKDPVDPQAKVLDDISFTIESVFTNGTPAIFDLNGDNLDDAVGINTSNINVHYQQPDGTMIEANISTPNANFAPSWSMAAGDLNNDGFADLVYGAGSGVSIMISEAGGTSYTEHSGPEYVFSQRTNMVDINNDGDLDVFVCHDVDPNVYYINDGNGNMGFVQGGLGDTPQGGNYGSVWIDYDNDHDVDLFIAKCGADPWNQLHRNDGDGVFTDVTVEVGLESNVQTWSSAWADYDNDGDMDLFVGASSTGNGSHQLMRNIDGNFVNVTVGSGFDDPGLGTSIENCTQDFNNDGYIDILGAGERLMLNNGDMTFTEYAADVSNGAIGDLNGDGFLDVITWNNVYMSDGNDNNHLRIHLDGVASNKDGIGARVEITSALGTQIRDIRSGEGFRSMSSLTAHFGLGQDVEVEQVIVYWPSGTVDIIESPEINTILVIVEGESAVGINELANEEWNIYPNPATDVLNIQSTANLTGASLEIIDYLGKQVIMKSVMSTQVDISSLNQGLYVLRIIKDGESINELFVKR